MPDYDRDALCAQLVHDVEVTHAEHITTGATVLKDVMPVLTGCGAAELAYRAATNPTFPGWGYWFRGLHGTRGAGGETILVDTFWEAWYAGSRSHNHAFRGTIDDWLYEYLAGIRPTAPGYREIRIQPHPVGDLTHTRASIQTPLGRVDSTWIRGDEAFELDVQVPVGATAEILVPVPEGGEVTPVGGAEARGVRGGHARFAVGSGSYRFVARPSASR